MGKRRRFISPCMTKSHLAWNRRAQWRSRGVFWRFTMTNFPGRGFPFLRTQRIGRFPAGRIRRLVPRQIQRSARFVFAMAVLRSSSGSASSQSSVRSRSTPPHSWLSHRRPVGLNPTPPTSKSRKYETPQASHFCGVHQNRRVRRIPTPLRRRCRAVPTGFPQALQTASEVRRRSG